MRNSGWNRIASIGLLVTLLHPVATGIEGVGRAVAAVSSVASTTHDTPGSGVDGVEVLCGPRTDYGCTVGGYTGESTGWPGTYYGEGQASRNEFGLHNCVLYASYRLKLSGVADPGWYDHASSWAIKAAANGTLVNSVAEVGAIAQWNANHVAVVESVDATGIVVTDDSFGWNVTAKYKITFRSKAFPDNFIHFGKLDSTRVAHKVVKAPGGFSYVVDDTGKPRWIPTVEAYYCAIGRGYPLYVRPITWAELESLGAEGPTYDDCLNPTRVAHKVVRAPGGVSYVTGDNGKSWRWIPTVEAFYCAIGRGYPLYPTVVTWAEKASVGAEGPAFPDCLATSRVINHVVRESGSGTAYFVTVDGKWHWIPAGVVYTCLRVIFGYPQLNANWTQINSLRGTKGENEGAWMSCP